MTAPADLPGFSAAQLERAAASLLKFVAGKDCSRELLDDDELLHLVVALKRAPTGPRKDKPLRIALPHALYEANSGAEVCLFVKDHKGEGHAAAKARLAKLADNGGVSKIVGLSKLRTKYESHEAKRQLCASYDLFLVDERVVPSLPKLLGKSFFKRKKQPVPVDIRSPNFAEHVRLALASTYMTAPNGTCVSVRVARSSMPQDAVAANALAALRGVVARVPKGWANVQAVYLKASESASLPVYQTLPDAAGEEEGDAGAAAATGGEGKKQQKQQPAAAAKPQKRQKADAAQQQEQQQQLAPAAKRAKKQEQPLGELVAEEEAAAAAASGKGSKQQQLKKKKPAAAAAAPPAAAKKPRRRA